MSKNSARQQSLARSRKRLAEARRKRQDAPPPLSPPLLPDRRMHGKTVCSRVLGRELNRLRAAGADWLAWPIGQCRTDCGGRLIAVVTTARVCDGIGCDTNHEAQARYLLLELVELLTDRHLRPGDVQASPAWRACPPRPELAALLG